MDNGKRRAMRNRVLLFIGIIDVAVAVIVIKMMNSKGMEILFFPFLIFIINILLCAIYLLLKEKLFSKAFGINAFVAPLLFILIDIIILASEDNKDFYYLSFKNVRYELYLYRESKQFCLRYSTNSNVFSGNIDQRNDTLYLILDWKNDDKYKSITDSLFIGDSLFIREDSLYGLKEYPIKLR